MWREANIEVKATKKTQSDKPYRVLYYKSHSNPPKNINKQTDLNEQTNNLN